jgi:CRP-like cAMP-binding protein
MRVGQIPVQQTSPCVLNIRGSNRLLTLLPASQRQRLLAHMERLSMDKGRSVYDPLQPISHVYFPLGAVMSVVIDMEEGGSVEVATIGNEGMVGVPLILGAQTSTDRAFVQVAGEAMRMPHDVFRAELAPAGPFFQLMQLYAQGYISQIAQSSACNRMHPVDQRLCRWVLMTHDRVGLDTLSLTQEFIAMMLGVRRASVSTAAAMLQKAGLIEYDRGIIHVLDRAGLEAGSCECYGIVRKELERLLCEPLTA